MNTKIFNHVFPCLSLIIFIIVCGCDENDECTDHSRNNITMAALLPLTGSGSSVGEGVKAALDIAETDINGYLVDIGSGINFSYEYEDTGTDTLLAQQKIENLYDRGYRTILGPASSSSVKAVKDYADNLGLLVVSYASVAPSLAIPGDNILRLVPSDEYQGQALTALLKNDGIEVIIPVIRDDLWGNELLSVTSGWFSMEGGVVADAVRYSTGTQDFSQVVNELSDNLNSVLMQYPAAKTGIYLASYGEGTDILEIASLRENLNEVNWYGSSGFAESKTLISNNSASEFAISQKLACPTFGLDDNAIDKWQPLANEIETVIGRIPEVYALVAYDAAWILTLSAIHAGDVMDIHNLKTVFTEIAYNYYGVTGWTGLNDAGDRAYANYDFFGVRKEGDGYFWVRTAKFNNATGELVRY